MNRILFPLLTLAFSVTPVFCWAAEPKADQSPTAAELPARASENDATQLKALQDERIKLLDQSVQILASQYSVGSADLNQYFSAENDLCNAVLDSTDEPEKRVALLTKHLETAKKVLEIAEAKVLSGTASQVDGYRAKASCLDIKIKLLRERSRMRTPASTPSAKQK